MREYHYTYITVLENHQLYVGKRKSKVNPLLDNYFGTIKKKCENWKPLNKYFLKFVTEPIINAFNECAFHSWLDVGKNPRFYNKAKQTSVGFDTTGIKLSSEIKQQYSERAKGNKYALGYKHTEAWKEEQSKRSRGNSYRIGHKHSKETRTKIALSNVGKHNFNHSEETKKKISESSTGRIVSDETKNKLSEANKRQIKEVYRWKHIKGFEETCTRIELINKYIDHKLHNTMLGKLIKGKTKLYKGWTFNGFA